MVTGRIATRARGAALFVALAVMAAGRPSGATISSAVELVEIARGHERAGAAELALRRYAEALAIDPTCAEAYLGLGALRARRGDLREADRVYSVALEHLPDLREARAARAHVRRALGHRDEAVTDLLAGAPGDVAALRVLAAWHGEDGQVPAQLGVWRRILAVTEARGDTAGAHEARTMVRALQLLVGPADPVSSPPLDPHVVGRGPGEGLRRLAAYLARRGPPVR